MPDEAESDRPGGGVGLVFHDDGSLPVPPGPAAATPGRPRGHLRPVAAVAALALLAFLPALPGRFLGEDGPAIEANRALRDLGNIPSFFGAAYWNEKGEGGRAYRPIVEVTLAVDYAVWGLRPAGFWLTNVVLHALVAVTVYAIAFQLSRHRAGALVAGALFAVHPIHAEAVNVIRNRGDLLGTLFLLLSWLTFVGVVEHLHARQMAGLSRASGVRGLVVGVVFFVFALFSKEVAITLPILLLIYTAALVPVGWRGWAGAQTLVWWVALWGYTALSLAAIQKYAPASFLNVPEGGRALLVVKSLGRNLLLLVAPASLRIAHPFDPLADVGGWSSSPVVATLAVLGVLALVCVAIFRRHRLAAFALAWLPITLLPVSNVVPDLKGPIAEHRLYLPSVGLCLLAGAVVAELGIRRIGRTPACRGAYRVAGIAAGVLAAAYLAGSLVRSIWWSKAIGEPSRTGPALTRPAERS